MPDLKRKRFACFAQVLFGHFTISIYMHNNTVHNSFPNTVILWSFLVEQRRYNIKMHLGTLYYVKIFFFYKQV